MGTFDGIGEAMGTSASAGGEGGYLPLEGDDVARGRSQRRFDDVSSTIGSPGRLVEDGEDAGMGEGVRHADVSKNSSADVTSWGPVPRAAPPANQSTHPAAGSTHPHPHGASSSPRSILADVSATSTVHQPSASPKSTTYSPGLSRGTVPEDTFENMADSGVPPPGDGTLQCWEVTQQSECWGWGWDPLNYGLSEGCIWGNAKSNFDNLPTAVLTLFEMATTEGWMDVMHKVRADWRGSNLVTVRGACEESSVIASWLSYVACALCHGSC